MLIVLFRWRLQVDLSAHLRQLNNLFSDQDDESLAALEMGFFKRKQDGRVVQNNRNVYCPRRHLDVREQRPDLRVVSVERVITAERPIRRGNVDLINANN
ncbi:hypothetical protein N7489_004610 [Penicillium chrysogenum]|uniref:uncharacterized protein n=1 Tax=Penicillium chrysogenum TaxID=5076 RepID=UPI0024DF24D9|nr:uncharacterized protein N7489_004610 [Penicillium chrysogenum]KAJ5244514.1 hypothetical protein N7489_004610 [Penicillium chrysogenum]KAJ5852975.1 hypothetical protein N7534_005518 [Penicillium rubens]